MKSLIFRQTITLTTLLGALLPVCAGVTLIEENFESYTSSPAEGAWTVNGATVEIAANNSPVAVGVKSAHLVDINAGNFPWLDYAISAPTNDVLTIQFDFQFSNGVQNAGFQLRSSTQQGINLHLRVGAGNYPAYNSGSGWTNLTDTALTPLAWYRYTLTVQPAGSATDRWSLRIESLEDSSVDDTYSDLTFQNQLDDFSLVRFHFNQATDPGTETEYWIDSVLVTADPPPILNDGFEGASGTPDSPPWTSTQSTIEIAARNSAANSGTQSVHIVDNEDPASVNVPRLFFDATGLVPDYRTAYIQFDYTYTAGVVNPELLVRGDSSGFINYPAFRMRMTESGQNCPSAKDGASWTNLTDAAMSPGKWYRFTITIAPLDQVEDKWSLRVQSIQNASVDSSYENMDFETDRDSLAKTWFYFANGTAASGSEYWIDNVLMTTDPDDLVYPVPPPAGTVVIIR